MNVIQEIATWAKKLPRWQSDALRRVFTTEKLSASDEDEICAMLLAAHKIEDGDQPVPGPIPFSEAVDEVTASARKVVLRELHSLCGVNALLPDQSVKFALTGLTVIYGENGVGKSGYARVLKHACQAREKAEPILPNVNASKKEKPVAVIELSVDGEDVALQWRAGCPPSELLSQIAVFDAHCARVFIDEANEVVYLPYGLDVFGKLAVLNTSLKNRIASRIAALPPHPEFLNDFTKTTTAGALVSSLSATTDVSQLETHSRLDEKQLARLGELRTIVATAKANPPRQRAAQLRRVKSRFDQLASNGKGVASSLSDEVLQNVKSLKAAAATAAKVAELASTQAFASDPIAATGSDPWRVLFEAARAFSQKVYPDEEFPVSRDGALCLLCQQPLSEDAAKRFQRFQQFILDDAATKKEDADTALRTAVTALTNTDVASPVADKTLIDELRAHDDALATAVEQFFCAAKLRKAAALLASTSDEWDAIPSLTQFPADAMGLVTGKLETTAQDFDRADKPDELRKLQEDLAELEDRERLGKHLDAIKTCIAQKKTEAALRTCEKALDTTTITKFGSELMEKAITEQLANSLHTELSNFDVRTVPLNIKKSGEKGKTKHQLTIQAGVRPSGVLSEGEQRVVAIAAFLAELSTSSSESPIVFDDPVSSLDHVFRERVAKRLVTEARTRQVIIFTHDIVMLLALERACAEQRVPLLSQTIRRSTQGPGECPASGERPWHASTTKDRLGVLKQFAAPLKKLREQDQPAYETAASELYGRLREAWERAIEEVLLQDVVQRFRPSVETQRLKRVMIEDKDYPIIECAMAKCSTWMTGHDAAAAIAASFPAHAELVQDIQVLDDFVKELRSRAEKTAAAAGALVDPPKAPILAARATKIIDLSKAAAFI